MADPIFKTPSTNPFNLTNEGTNANPTFVDIDDDGDLDAFIGNALGNTLFYVNTGTASAPIFDVPSTNPFGLTDIGANASPTFVDIDADGDLDAFIGNTGGTTRLYLNTGTATAPVFTNSGNNPFGLTDIGANASPTFGDIDGDGDLDALIGTGLGNTLFYRNTGTASAPVFDTPITNEFGLTNVGTFASPTFVDIDSDGDLDALMIGNNAGNTLFYRNTGTASVPVFAVSSINPFGLTDVGTNANPTFVDIDGDGDLDALIGNGAGNTLFYINNSAPTLSEFAAPIANGVENSEVVIDFAALQAQGNEADVDGSVTAFIVKAVSSGSLTIGASASTATPWAVGTNDVIDATHLAYWTPATDDFGTLDAFTVVAVDDGGVESDTAIQTTIEIKNIIFGTTGDDILDGTTGEVILKGLEGNDSYLIDSIGDIVIETVTNGSDTVQASIDFTLPDNVENLTLTGTDTIDATGNALANLLIGNSANNALIGNDGNDILDGGLGDDSLNGGTGNDIYLIDSSADVIVEAALEGFDRVIASASFVLPDDVETLTLTGTEAINATGNASDNVLTGNLGNNTLIGDAGNDTLYGNEGSDTLYGGDGDDRYGIESIGDVVFEAADEGIDFVISRVSFTLSDNVENITLLDVSAIDATGNSLDNDIRGNTGNNVLRGNDGNDTLFGGGGNDTMIGGAGDDTYTVDSILDTVTEDALNGIDTVDSSVSFTLPNNVENVLLKSKATIATGNSLDNVLQGNSFNNQLLGHDGIDTLYGYAGNDTLDGGLGDDTLDGGKGNDIYIVDSLGDIITELTGAGTDNVQTNLSFTLPDFFENLTLTGLDAIDGTGNTLANTLQGNSADNILFGDDGIDKLLGNIGNDTLDGGAGRDTLTGGAGQDTFVLSSALAINSERIVDFNVLDDTLQLDSSVFTALTTGLLDSASFKLGTKAADANDYLIYNQANGSLLYDADGNGVTAAIPVAVLGLNLALTNADFMVL